MKPSPGFRGFPEGKQPTTPVPNLFFSQVLPAVDHLGELKVTLYVFWALARKAGRFRCITSEELAADRRLMAGLGAPGTPPREALDEALERAVARGTLLRVAPSGAGPGLAYYLVNSARGRAAAKALETGAWHPQDQPPGGGLSVEHPNVFGLYEQNFGPLTPMIAEALQEAEATYPPGWIEDAMRIAVENNVRKWRYVEAILEDWRLKGRDEREDLRDSEKARRRYAEGDFADFIEH